MFLMCDACLHQSQFIDIPHTPGIRPFIGLLNRNVAGHGNSGPTGVDLILKGLDLYNYLPVYISSLCTS